MLNRHRKRRYKGSTTPRQCARLIPTEGMERIPMQCPERVYKAGVCAKHWQEAAFARTQKALQEPAEPVKRCSVYKCFKTAVISANDTLWCLKHFYQNNPIPTEEESTDAKIQVE